MVRVLMTYPRLIPSVLLCGHLQLSYLAQQGRLAFRAVARKYLTPEDCGWADVVMMVRSDSEKELALAKKWKFSGKLVIYVLDDDLLSVPEQISAGAYYAQPYVKRAIQEMLALCDVLVSPSSVLIERYGKNKGVLIEEPAPLHPDKQSRYTRPVRIGFAGSIDRGDDLDALLTNVIGTLLEKYGDSIAISFLGAHPKLADYYQLPCIPYCEDYESYQEAMQTLDWDIGLAPMPETTFHACKHYNKYIEYAGCGIAGVYSAVMPYTQIVSNRTNGLLCPNDVQSWVDALSLLIDDAALRRRISQYAQSQAREQFTTASTAVALEDALGKTLSHVAPDHNPLELGWSQSFVIHLRRAFFSIQRYGVRTPLVLTKKIIAKLQKGNERFI